MLYSFLSFFLRPRGPNWPGSPHRDAGAVFTTSAAIHPERVSTDKKKPGLIRTDSCSNRPVFSRPDTSDFNNKRSVHLLLRSHAPNPADTNVSRLALNRSQARLVSFTTVVRRVVKQELLKVYGLYCGSGHSRCFYKTRESHLSLGKCPEALGAELYPFNF